MTERKVPFVDDEDCLRGFFDLGLSLDDGVRELIDNALDANAKNIWILFDPTQGTRLHLIVGDDGDGIPDTVEDEFGDHQPGIPFVMAFGAGKNIMPSKKGAIGIFGFGLSSTITCLAKDVGQATVFSKNQGNEQWRCSKYQFEDIIDNDCKLPNEFMENLPFLPPGETGTVVDIELHETEDARPNAHLKRLLSTLGRTYRRKLAEGISITIAVLGKNENHRAIEITDPLVLNPKARETKVLGQAIEYNVPDIVFDEDNDFGCIIDPNTNEPARIQVRLSLIPRTLALKRLEDELKGKDGIDRQKILNKYGIGYDHQGFSLLREGRELATAKTFGIYAKHNMYNYMHGEIDFPTCLDALFDIQTNKSQYHVSRKMKDVFVKHIKPYTDQIFADTRQAQEHQKIEADDIAYQPKAEQIAQRIRPLLPQVNVTQEEKKKGEEIRAAQRDIFIKAAKDAAEPTLEVLRQGIERATEGAEKEEAEAAMADAEAQLEAMIERIRRRWDPITGIRILEESLGEAELYAVRDAGDEAHIVVNTDTLFHELIYAEVKSDDSLRGLLDIMLATIGYTEYFDRHIEDEMLPHYWTRVRQEVSLNAEQFVKAMPVHSEVNTDE